MNRKHFLFFSSKQIIEQMPEAVKEIGATGHPLNFLCVSALKTKISAWVRFSWP